MIGEPCRGEGEGETADARPWESDVSREIQPRHDTGAAKRSSARIVLAHAAIDGALLHGSVPSAWVHARHRSFVAQ